MSESWSHRGARARLGLIALVVVAYVAAGLGCLLLSVPPSQFAPLWLPSGIGVAVLLHFGRRAWPGVFLGDALLAAVLLTPVAGDLSQAALVGGCLCVAAGASLAAGIAAAAVERFAPDGAIFERVRAVGCLVITAFATGAISAAVGVGIVTAIGVVRLEGESCQIFVASWLRSAASILLVVPYAQGWAQQRAGSRVRWVLELVTPIALMLVAVGVAYGYANRLLGEERRLAFERRSAAIARSVEREFEVAAGSVAALRDLYDSTRQVDEDSFRVFTQRVLARHASLALLAWAPDVGNGSYPLARVGALGSTRGLIGFDLARSAPIAAALARARDEGVTVASRTLRLPHAPGRNDAVVVVRAIYRASGEPQTPEERRAGLSGYAIAVLHLGDVVAAASVGVPTEGLGYRLIDLATPTASWSFGGPVRPDSATWSSRFEVADRAWQIDVHAVNVYEPGVSFWGPSVVMIAGTLLAGALGLFLLSANGRAARIERIVLERTAELERARRAATEADRNKSVVVADLSHDLRTPLTAIIGFADLLLEPGHADPERREWAQIVRRSAGQLLELVNDVLDVSKLEAGRLEVETIPTSPWHLIQEVIELMSERARSKGIGCEAAWIGPVPEVIGSDPQRLRQILINLVSNAVKFTESGGVLVVARLVRGPEGVQQLQIEVADTGIGIPAEQIPRVFESFRQGDASTSRRYGGTGLGLRISRDLARLLGGDVEVESEVGVGTTLRLRVATGDLSGVRLLDPGAEEPIAEDAPGLASALDGEVWLIGADAPAARHFARMLEYSGASVVSLASARAALERLARAPLAIVLGAGEGSESARALRDGGYSGPLVALERRGMAAEAWLAAGCDACFAEPFERKPIAETLARLVLSR